MHYFYQKKSHRNVSRSNIYNYLFIDMSEDWMDKVIKFASFCQFKFAKEYIKNSIHICIQSLYVYRLDRITNAKIFLVLLTKIIYAKYIQAF